MNYLGIDIGKYQHVAALCNDKGNLLKKPLSFSNDFKGWQALLEFLEGIDKKKTIVGMEATGPYWLSLQERLAEQEFSEITILNPLEVKAYRHKGIRGNKTDRIDAKLIADILRFGDFKKSYVFDEKEQELFTLRELCRLRSNLVELIGSLKLRIISLLDRIFPEYSQLFNDVFGTSSRALLKQSPLPEEIAKLSTRKLTNLLKKASRGRFGKEKAQKIKEVSRQSFGSKLALDVSALSCKILLFQIEHLEFQVDEIEKQIIPLFKKQDTKLTSIPGIGDIIGAQVLSEIGDFSRIAFLKDGAEKLVALAGLDPKIKQSGIDKGKIRMSKRGSPYLRKAIRQAAFVAVFAKKDPMFKAIYERQKSKGKHFEVALSHVSRKMIHVIFSVLKNNKNYEPHL